MSAPAEGSANGSPVPGYYPDPSIPGYIRYWDGTTWVPGTSTPHPAPGEPFPEPPPPGGRSGGRPAPAADAGQPGVPQARTGDPAPAEETGPAFPDEGGQDQGTGTGADDAGQGLPEVRRRGEVATPDAVTDWDDPRRLHGHRPEVGSAWNADSAQQTGFGDDAEQPISWGSPSTQPSASPEQAEPAGPSRPSWSAADPRGGAWGAADDAQRPGGAGEQEDSPDTVGIRLPRPSGSEPEHTVGLRRSDLLGGSPSGRDQPGGAPAPGTPGAPAPGTPGVPPQGPAGGQHGGVPGGPGDPTAYGGVPAQGYAGAPGGTPGHPAPAAPGQPGQQAAPQGGEAPRPAWAQQVHDLAQHGQPPAPGQPQGHGGPGMAAPWRPPAADPFAQAAQEARPAGLGRRLGARIVDNIVVFGVAGATALPFVGKATEHIQDKIDAAKMAGVTRTVWLVDGTTGVYLAAVLGAFLVFGLLYEALPTARWGRTLGKKMFGVRVLHLERQDAPGTGPALRRWLTYSVLSLLAVGVLNVMWCLFDRPWRQCWHDKAARTFVAGR